MYLWWMVALLVVVGHFALHLVIYNRINATGLSRGTIRVIKYFFMGTCLLIPVAVVVGAPQVLAELVRGQLDVALVPLPLALYAGLALATLVVYGPSWLLSRPSLNRDAIHVRREVRQVAVEEAVGESLAVTHKCRFHSRLPMNQLFQLAIERKEVPVRGLPSELEGLKIAHLSDVHLTGHVSPAFYRYVVEQAVQWDPDLIALTGDIVDKERCIEWLDECFSQAAAPHGCYFVLGNHDLRVRRPASVRERLVGLGWRDLGGRKLPTEIRGTSVEIMGNEAPWFPAPEVPPADSGKLDPETFRLLLSHSPDQIQWARQRNVHLMLAGHTHGGQGRLPWIGPVLSPSRYGSRYASGTFYLEPTTMHVSRGLSGVHLMRIRCPPELALLTLRRCPGSAE